jgi:hypothetical protein
MSTDQLTKAKKAYGAATAQARKAYDEAKAAGFRARRGRG